MNKNPHKWRLGRLRLSVKEKLALNFLFLTSVGIVALVIVSVIITRAHLRERTISQLISEAAAKEDAIEMRFRRDWELTSLWSKRDDVRSAFYSGYSSKIFRKIIQDAREEGISITGVGFISNNKIVSSEGTLKGDISEIKIGGIYPVISKQGWQGHSVAVPIINNNGDLSGYIVAEFNIKDFLNSISNVVAVGKSAEVIIAREEKKLISIIQHKYISENGLIFEYGDLSEGTMNKDPIALTLNKQEGATMAKNYQGRDVYAAYRYLPRIGWGLLVTVDVDEALVGAQTLAIALFAVGLVLLGMSAMLSVSLASRLSKPLIRICKGLEGLGPNQWKYEKSVNTGDELEMVDDTVFDLVGRLSRNYKYMEKQVCKRTKELQEQYERNKTILKSIIHGVVLCDDGGGIISINSAAEKLLKTSEDVVIGLPATTELPLLRNEERVSDDNHPITLCLKSNKTISQSYDKAWSLRDTLGDNIAVDFSVTPILNGGTIIGAVAVFRDVSEERKVDEMKSEFISLASHQLRTPLSVINWYRELLEAEAKESEIQIEYLREIGKAGQRMSDLVSTLLQTAKLESKGITAQVQDIDICKFFIDISKESEVIAAQKSIKWRHNIPREKIIISTDPVLLHIIIQNIFSNAFKYTEEGGKVEAKLEKKKDKIIISVNDSGIGIPDKEQERIFERLFRANNAKDIDTTGSGLGLYISKMIVEVLGGEISFKSRKDKGSTFEVVIPS
ncbi:MAG: PAS domain-containing protein [Candidatus Peribacteraceae bacterium]|nr:PAS domain-containing protein [Candidatus Peribacteraceae bacterium]